MKNRSIVNLNSPDEVKKMGKLLAEINIENNIGVVEDNFKLSTR